MSAVTIRKLYTLIFNDMIAKKNFIRKKDLFFRLINDEVLQTLCIQISQLGHSFTINIGFFPLSVGIMDIEQLKDGRFRLGYYKEKYDYWWEYGLPYSGSDEEVVKDAFAIVQQKIYPLFDDLVNSHSIIEYMNVFENEVYGQTIENSSFRLDTYIKTAQYHKAINTINRIKEQNLNAIAAVKDIYSDDQFKARKNRIDTRFKEFQAIIDAISRNDQRYLDDLVIQNEEQSWKILEELGIRRSKQL